MQILAFKADDDLAEMLRVYFREKGHQISLEDQPEDISHLLKKVRPDLITIDHHPPNLDAFELYRQLKASLVDPRTPVIFLLDERVKKRIPDAGDPAVVDFVTKPLALSKLDFLVQQRLREVEERLSQKRKKIAPEWLMVDNKLSEMQRQGSWGVVVAGLGGLKKFGELYGQIAANDVSLAVNFIVQNAMKASKIEDAYIGSVGPADYAVITTAEPVEQLARQCQVRLERSIRYFYPDYEDEDLETRLADERLTARVTSLSSADTEFATYEDIRTAFIDYQ